LSVKGYDKNKKPLKTVFYFILFRLVTVPSVSIAITAVNRPVVAGLKGYLGRRTAICTGDIIHLSPITPSVPAAVVCFSGSPAFGTPSGFILKALLNVEFLFGSAEYELVAAITAC
jgi:hypothetical protein